MVAVMLHNIGNKVQSGLLYSRYFLRNYIVYVNRSTFFSSIQCLHRARECGKRFSYIAFQCVTINLKCVRRAN